VNDKITYAAEVHHLLFDFIHKLKLFYTGPINLAATPDRSECVTSRASGTS
jgi:hypothetical protein